MRTAPLTKAPRTLPGGWVALGLGLALLLSAGGVLAQAPPAAPPPGGTKAVAAPATLERSLPHSARPRAEAGGPAAAPYGEPLARKLPPFRAPANAHVPDSFEVFFFTETRPLRVRICPEMAGKPLARAWEEEVRKLFAYFDRDGDGYLNAYELEFAFPARGVQQMLQAGFYYRTYNDQMKLADLDRDRDGKVSFDELLAYYAPAADRLVRAQPVLNPDPFAAVLTDELFKLLDADKDGRLSKAELDAAEKFLSVMDQDEDECLTALELVPNLTNRPRPAPIVRPQNGPIPALNGEPFQVYRTGTVPEGITGQMLARYDRDKNLRLSRAEVGLDEATFNRLDRNGDGELSITELEAWREGPPDLDIALTLGTKPSEGKAMLLPGPDGKSWPLGGALKVTGGHAHLRIGTQGIDLGVFSAAAPVNVPGGGQPFAFAFQQADSKNKGYLEEKDLVGPQFQFVRVIFDAADRDGDGRLTKKEFDAYFEIQRRFQGMTLVLAHGTQVPSLFQLLDANGDARLSVRELRDAWARLRDLEPGGGEYVTRAAIQAQASLTFGRANQVLNNPNRVNILNPVAPVPSRGPVWFRKMDRNGDGEVSRAEFLGKKEDFDRLDLNGDGLISPEEAEAADRAARPAPADRR